MPQTVVAAIQTDDTACAQPDQDFKSRKGQPCLIALRIRMPCSVGALDGSSMPFLWGDHYSKALASLGWMLVFGK